MTTWTCCRTAKESTGGGHDWDCPLHGRHQQCFPPACLACADKDRRIAELEQELAQVRRDAESWKVASHSGLTITFQYKNSEEILSICRIISLVEIQQIMNRNRLVVSVCSNLWGELCTAIDAAEIGKENSND